MANYTDLGIELPATSNEAYIQYLQKGMLPKTHGGGSTTYVTDYFWSYLNDAARNYMRLGLVGGRLNDGSRCGLSARFVYYGLGVAGSFFGFRLCAVN